MQLELPWNDSAALQEMLEEESGLSIALTVTDNSRNLLSVKPDGAPERVVVRMHHMFLAADTKTLRALAEWIRRPKAQRSGELLDAFIRANRHRIRPQARRPRTIRVCSRGRCHDLQKLYDEVNQQHFDGQIQAHITWGQMPQQRRRRRSIRFGSYNHELNLIRIHPLLDQDFVPEFFVRYIVFHEMLHAFLGISESSSGRRQIHTREFRTREKAYPEYARALAWQEKSANLTRLLK